MGFYINKLFFFKKKTDPLFLFLGTLTDCKGFMGNSLFLVGEIGWNDYNHPFVQGKTIDEIRTFVPNIIQVISSAITVSSFLSQSYTCLTKKPILEFEHGATQSFSNVAFYLIIRTWSNLGQRHWWYLGFSHLDVFPYISPCFKARKEKTTTHERAALSGRTTSRKNTIAYFPRN